MDIKIETKIDFNENNIKHDVLRLLDKEGWRYVSKRYLPGIIGDRTIRIVMQRVIVKDDLLPHITNSLSPFTLMRIHPELTYNEAEDLMKFAKSKTITHEECYGDGSIIYPMWKKANSR